MRQYVPVLKVKVISASTVPPPQSTAHGVLQPRSKRAHLVGVSAYYGDQLPTALRPSETQLDIAN